MTRLAASSACTTARVAAECLTSHAPTLALQSLSFSRMAASSSLTRLFSALSSASRATRAAWCASSPWSWG